MKPVCRPECRCPMSKAGMIEHSLRLCPMVLQRRAVLRGLLWLGHDGKREPVFVRRMLQLALRRGAA